MQPRVADLHHTFRSRRYSSFPALDTNTLRTSELEIEVTMKPVPSAGVECQMTFAGPLIPTGALEPGFAYSEFASEPAPEMR